MHGVLRPTVSTPPARKVPCSQSTLPCHNHQGSLPRTHSLFLSLALESPHPHPTPLDGDFLQPAPPCPCLWMGRSLHAWNLDGPMRPTWSAALTSAPSCFRWKLTSGPQFHLSGFPSDILPQSLLLTRQTPVQFANKSCKTPGGFCLVHQTRSCNHPPPPQSASLYIRTCINLEGEGVLFTLLISLPVPMHPLRPVTILCLFLQGTTT